MFSHLEAVLSRAAAPLHGEEPAEVIRVFGPNVSCMPPWGGVLSMSYWAEAQ